MILTPNPIALIVAVCSNSTMAIASGQQYLDSAVPIVRDGVGQYIVNLIEDLPVVQSPFAQNAVVLATVQQTPGTTGADSRTVECTPNSVDKNQLLVMVRNGVTGVLDDEATVVLAVFRQPTVT